MSAQQGQLNKDGKEEGCGPSNNSCPSRPRNLPNPKGDAVALTDCEYASLLEARLAQIKNDHEESLDQIKQQKKQQLLKISEESKASGGHQIRQPQEEDTERDNWAAIHAMIDALNENNQALCQQNEELWDEIRELEDENSRLVEETTQLCASCVDLRVEIEAAKTRQVELLEAEKFLIRCIKEYERDYRRINREFDETFYSR